MNDDLPRCSTSGCGEIEVYKGLCLRHAEEQYGPHHPTAEDLSSRND